MEPKKQQMEVEQRRMTAQTLKAKFREGISSTNNTTRPTPPTPKQDRRSKNDCISNKW